MSRDHKRTPGSRQYLHVSKEKLEAAIKPIQEDISKRDAKIEFGIPKTTLVKGKCILRT